MKTPGTTTQGCEFYPPIVRQRDNMVAASEVVNGRWTKRGTNLVRNFLVEVALRGRIGGKNSHPCVVVFGGNFSHPCVVVFFHVLSMRAIDFYLKYI
jgi:hypothetical protein